MLAAHKDQENLVSIHQANAVTKHQNQGSTRSTLQPKTPGTRYPKTPLKIPLNDENGVRALGGKSNLVNKTNGDKSQWVTPAEPRTGRPVLGDKTTNAKARFNQQTIGKTPSIRDIEKSQAKPTTVSRPKSSAPKSDSYKIQILQDTTSDPLSTSEPDTNAPPPEPLPYESDVWPAGVLTFDAIRPENRMNGYYEHYHNRRDENGMTRVDREMKAAQERRFREADAKIRKDLDEDFKWDLGLLDSPKRMQQIVPARDPEPLEKKFVRPGGLAKAPSTMNSRRAASALGMASKLPTTSSTLQRRPLATRTAASTNVTSSKLPSFMQPTMSKPRPAIAAPRPQPSSTAGLAASRSTLGYTKGRSASSAIQAAGQQHVRGRSEAPSRMPTRASSSASNHSAATVTPANYAKDHVVAKPEFVSIFDEPPKDENEEDDIDCSLFDRDNGDSSIVSGQGEGEGEFRLELSP
ncbi:hypothetical protein VP1G_04585 [Cytospora mali]|uniref:Uncharacterized protein n=1 Tax=Cytospora mali TaxID=578113 RepID=A0A194V063_CYTMA|nr:hypothetical protein VP1G_04585 [Valsa mali var. pyri (nom. inval.)]